MRMLLFTLAAPRASFGSSAAAGDERDSLEAPSRSALLGLIAAAQGCARSNSAALDRLRDGLAFASRLDRTGSPEIDFHTAQVAKRKDLKRRAVRVRGDELDVRRDELTTILSSRMYRCDYHATVAVAATAGEADPTVLEAVAEALRRPKWMLYLGRKSAPLGWPLDPQIVEAATLESACDQYDAMCADKLGGWPSGRQARVPVSWTPPKRRSRTHTRDQFVADEAFAALLPEGALPTDARKIIRRDVPIDRQRWLFANQQRIHWERATPPDSKEARDA